MSPNINTISYASKAPKRSRSSSLVVPTIVQSEEQKRNHSSSVSSVDENYLYDIMKDSNYNHKGKIRLLDDADLEKQMISTAGGKKEYVLIFIIKLTLLMCVVATCGVLILYAL